MARAGLRGSASQLPFMSRFQRLLPEMDLSSVRAHTDPLAAATAARIGTRAYTLGDDVAFGPNPSPHTVAHEVAHVLQQRAGLTIPGGVGHVGDSHEKQADAAADALVQGKTPGHLPTPRRAEVAAPVLQGEVNSEEKHWLSTGAIRFNDDGSWNGKEILDQMGQYSP